MRMHICTRGRQTGGEEINQTVIFRPHYTCKQFVQHWANFHSIIVFFVAHNGMTFLVSALAI